MWIEVFISMSGGSQVEYEKIKALSVFEFWKIYDLWKARTEAERDFYKAKKMING